MTSCLAITIASMFPIVANGTREVRICWAVAHLFIMLDITASSQAHDVQSSAAGRAHHLEVSVWTPSDHSMIALHRVNPSSVPKNLRKPNYRHIPQCSAGRDRRAGLNGREVLPRAARTLNNPSAVATQ